MQDMLTKYATFRSFGQILRALKHDRLFISSQENPYSIHFQASFMERNGRVHKLEAHASKDDSQAKEEIKKLLTQDGERLFEGIICFSPFTGHIYHVFETSCHNNDSAMLDSYTDWFNAAKDLRFTQGTELRYALRAITRRKVQCDIFDVIIEREIPATLHLLTFPPSSRQPYFTPVTDLTYGLKADENQNLDELRVINHTEELQQKSHISFYACPWFFDLPTEEPN